MNPDNNNETVSTQPADKVVNQPHPVNQITPVSKYLAMALFVLLPFVGGYVGYQLAEDKVVQIDTAPSVIDNEVVVEQVEEEDVSGSASVSGLVKYRDETVGFEFMYPAEWGSVSIVPERGICPDSYSSDPCMFNVYAFDHIGEAEDVIFMAVETKGHHDYPVGRGAFWGDVAGDITETYLEKCLESGNCNVIQNSKNLSIAKYRIVLPVYEADLSNFDNSYHIYRSDSPYYGYVLSPARLKYLSPEIEQIFESTVIETFTF